MRKLTELEQGRALARILNTGEKPEIVVFGAVFIDAPVKAFLEACRGFGWRSDWSDRHRTRRNRAPVAYSFRALARLVEKHVCMYRATYP